VDARLEEFNRIYEFLTRREVELDALESEQ
jgi:hypothetical protein